MSMICFYCCEPVYTAETKTYDGKTFHHGVCFGIWKKEIDRGLALERHAEYSKIPDVSPTKVRDPNYNTVIYATQYDPIGTQPNSTFSGGGTQPNSAYSGSPTANPASSDTPVDNYLSVSAKKERPRSASFLPRPVTTNTFTRRVPHTTFIPRPYSGTFSKTSSGTLQRQDSGTWTRASAPGTFTRQESGTWSRSTPSTFTRQDSATWSRSDGGGGGGSSVGSGSGSGSTFSRQSGTWTKTTSGTFTRQEFSSRSPPAGSSFSRTASSPTPFAYDSGSVPS